MGAGRLWPGLWRLIRPGQTRHSHFSYVQVPFALVLGYWLGLPQDHLDDSSLHHEAPLVVEHHALIARAVLGPGDFCDKLQSARDIGELPLATDLARKMVCEWGMSEKLGFVRYAGSDSRESYVPERDYSEDTARIIDEEIRRMIDDAFGDAERLVNENWDKISILAEALLKYETLNVEDVQRIIRGEALNLPTVVQMLSTETPAPTAIKVDPPEPEIGIMPSPA